MYMRSDAPYKTIEDIQKATTPPKCGSTGTAGTDYILARLLEDTLGAKIEHMNDIESQTGTIGWPLTTRPGAKNGVLMIPLIVDDHPYATEMKGSADYISTGAF